jgi:hypothetical protein
MAQVLGDQVVGVFAGDWLAGDEDSVVDGADQLLDDELDVRVGREVAAGDGLEEWLAVSLALVGEVVGAEAVGEC